MKYFKVIGIIILILFQLFAWFSFCPSSASSDPWYDLGRIFYFIIFFPVGIFGLLVSVPTLHGYKINNVKPKKYFKILIWTLLITSFCTAFPPLFLVVRYVFYPLESIL